MKRQDQNDNKVDLTLLTLMTLLTLVHKASKNKGVLKVRIENPVIWVMEETEK